MRFRYLDILKITDLAFQILFPFVHRATSHNNFNCLRVAHFVVLKSQILNHVFLDSQNFMKIVRRLFDPDSVQFELSHLEYPGYI